MNPRWMVLTVVIGALGIGSDLAYAEGCDDWPFGAGDLEIRQSPAECLVDSNITVPSECGKNGKSWVEAGPKILATGYASVDFDDSDEVIDAIQEATMEAKAVLSKFFSETIQSDESIETAIKKNTKIVKGPEGDQKTGTKEKTKVTLKRIAIHSQFLLSGIIKLAECYTKEDHVLVTMGLKPGTIAAAEAATGAIGASVAKQPTTTEATAAASSGSAASTGTGSGGTECTDTASSGCTGTATTGPDSYTKGVEKLKDF
ncbi:MAG: hypothetical protein QF755_00395 [Candidatus Peribacteraceae bacterium]|nr:hypothetical protein [Candidatus Peribacteraceae bacterium]